MCYQLRRIEAVKTLGRTEVCKVYTHHQPSLDDICAISAIFHFGERRFNLSDDLQIVFADRGEMESTLESFGDDIRLLAEDKSLVVGMAGSFLDEHEHPRNGHSRAAGHCTATLTAKLLNLNSDVYWQNIARYALADDTGTRSDWKYLDAMKTLPNLLKTAYNTDPGNVKWVVPSAVQFVKSYYDALRDGKVNMKRPNWSLDKLVEFSDGDWANDAYHLFMTAHVQKMSLLEEAKKLLPEVKHSVVQRHNGQRIGVAVIETDFDDFQKLVFSEKRGNNVRVDVLICKRSNGQCQIFSRNGKKINLSPAISLLRRFEMQMAGKPVVDGINYYVAGTIKECPEWNLFKPDSGNDMIFNGSKTAPDIPATKLSLETIIKAVVLGLSKT